MAYTQIAKFLIKQAPHMARQIIKSSTPKAAKSVASKVPTKKNVARNLRKSLKEAHGTKGARIVARGLQQRAKKSKKIK